MQIPLTVEFHDGTKQDVDAIFVDLLTFERERKKSVARLEIDMQLTDIAFLAWTTLKRQGKTTARFDPDWVTTVKMVSSRETEESAPLDS